MNLHEKLLEMQKKVDSLIKDGKQTTGIKYDFASNENVLDHFRPMMDEYGLLLLPRVESATLHETPTSSGASRYMTEMTLTMTWFDVKSGETLSVPWYAQGVDTSGEKGVGKALTYGEKYFLLKFFHVPTKKDDPDRDGRTRSGDKPQKGTAAAKETAAYCRAAVKQMLDELYGEDEEKKKAACVAMTKSDARGYAGVDSPDAVSDAAMPIFYGKIKKKYEERVGHKFELKTEEEETEC